MAQGLAQVAHCRTMRRLEMVERVNTRGVQDFLNRLPDNGDRAKGANGRSNGHNGHATHGVQRERPGSAENASKRIKVGVAGCGYWGPQLVRNFSELPEAELVAVADVRPSRLDYVRARY